MQSGNDEAVVSLVIDASGLRQGSAEAVALGKRLIDSFKAVEAAANAVGGVVSSSGVKIVESTSSTARFLDQLERKLNPLADAAKKAEAEMQRLIGIMGGSNVEAVQRASVALELQAKKVLDLKNAIVLASGENKRLEATYISLERAFQNAIGSLGSLTAKYQPAGASAKQMTSELASLNSAMKAGLVTEEQYISLNSKIVNSYNEGAVAAQKLAESRARLIAQGRADQNIQTAQLGIMNVTGQQAGPDFSRDLRLQMEKDNELLTFEKQIDNEILNSKKQRLAQEVAARRSATDAMISDLRRFQSEQEKADRERKQFFTQMGPVAAPQSNVAQHTQEVAKTNADIAKSAKDAADRIDYLSTRFNQDATAAKNYRQTISDLNEAFSKNLVGHRELGIETSKAIDTYNRSTVAGQKATVEHKKLSGSIHEIGLNSRLAQYAMTNFSFQINDVVSGLAMGQNPMRIFAQQAGQFVQIFQQIGAGNIGQFFRDMGNNIANAGAAVGRWLITPWGLVVTGITAVSVALATMLIRTVSNESQMRRFEASLAGVGPVSANTSRDLLKLSFDLRAIGLSADEAEKSINKFARNLSVNRQNPQAIRTLTQLGLDVGARLGIGDEAGTDKLNEAIKQGAEAVAQLGLETRAFTQEEAAAILISSSLGNRLNELEQAVKRLSDRLEGTHEKQRSGFSKLFDSIGEGWNKIVNKTADTGIFSGIDSLFSRMATNLKFIIENGKLAPDSAINREVGIVSNLFSPFPTEQEMKNRAKGLMRQEPSVYGPGAAAGGYNIVSGGALVPGTAIRSTRTPPPINSTNWFSESGSGNLDGSLRPDQADSFINEKENAAFARRFNVPVRSGNVVPFPGVPRFSQQGMGSVLAKPNADRQVEFERDLDLNQSGNLFNLPSDQLAKEIELTDKLNKRSEKRIEISKTWGITNKELTAFAETYNSALDSQVSKSQATERAETASNETRKIAVIDLQKASEVRGMETDGINKEAQAYNNSTSEAIKARAWSQALIESKTTEVDVNVRYREILAQGAAEALKGAAEQVASQVPVLTGLQKQAEAQKVSELAARNVRIENEANVIVQRALDAAIDGGKGIRKEEIESLKEKAKAQILAREAAQFSIETTRFVNQQTDSQQVLQLQTQMQGQTTEEINRQVVLLQFKQQMERESPGQIDSEKNARLAAVEATQRQVLALNEAQRVQQRLENTIRSIADTIENTLTRSITDAFDGKKVEDWGTKIRSVLGSVVSQITSSQFIKPAIGSILGAVGLSGLAQQYGTFGTSLFANNTPSSSTTNGSITLTPNSSTGGFDVKKLGDVAGVGKGLFDLFGSSGSSSGGGFLSGLFGGGNSGLTGMTNSAGLFGSGGAFSSQGALFGTAADLSIMGGGPPLALGAGGEAAFAAAGGAEGLGLGSAASGIFGSVGSVLGTALPILGIGMGIASLFGFNPIDMLFKKSKPSNSTGGGVDISTGKISGFDQEGNGANAQAAKGFLQSISQFSTGIQKLSGGGLSGSTNPQVFTNQAGKTVYKVGYNDIGDFGSGEIKFQDEQEAMKVISLALARSLTGISDAMKQVISTIEDPQLLEAGIQFAKLYDDLKTAADSAFSSIPNDLNKIGPFAEALKQINEIFADITEKAIGFGLSLVPVNAALAEATKRLRDDFNRSIKDAILGLEDPIKMLIKQEKDAGLARVKDAVAVGGDVVQVNRLNAMMLNQIWENQTQNLKQLMDSLRTGGLSGLTIGGQIEAANDNFRHSLSLVQGGNLNEIGNLTTNAGSAFGLSQQAYGNAPQTARLRNEILTSVDGILARRSFAIGTDFTPSGWIRVGENGPEWFNQSGGGKVLASGQQPFSEFGEMVAEIRMLRNEVQMLREENTRVVLGVGQDTGKRIDGVRGELRKKPLVETIRARA